MAPAGLCVVIIREDLIGDTQDRTPTMLQYKTYSENESMYNTPPCYTIYMLKLVLEWLRDEVGGLAKMKARNEKKAAVLYDYLDSSGLFRGCAEKASRSMMNVTFVTGDKELDDKFCKEAKAAGFYNLKGHRSVGGMRASIYNAMPVEGVEKLVAFMREFEEKNNSK
jgi:phosphoserine aminotransferase